MFINAYFITENLIILFILLQEQYAHFYLEPWFYILTITQSLFSPLNNFHTIFNKPFSLNLHYFFPSPFRSVYKRGSTTCSLLKLSFIKKENLLFVVPLLEEES